MHFSSNEKPFDSVFPLKSVEGIKFFNAQPSVCIFSSEPFPPPTLFPSAFLNFPHSLRSIGFMTLFAKLKYTQVDAAIGEIFSQVFKNVQVKIIRYQYTE